MIGHYLRRAHEMPPRMLVRKATRKCGRIIKNGLAELKARLTSTYISDEDFVHSLEGFDTLGEFLRHIRTRQRPHFFVDPSDKDLIIRALRQRFPTVEKLVVAEADKVCAHIFDLLGSGDMNLDEFKQQHPASGEMGYLPWHCDFKSAHRWNPKTYYKRIRRAPYPGGYDIKVPWELSRCQHFVRLGQAYWFTGDETYAREFVAQVTDWIEQNPPHLGVNWACTMDVATRAVNWIWGYYFFRDSSSLTNEFRGRFFKSLLSHGRHIVDNLERGACNHYISDLVGLVYLGITFPEFGEAETWREIGLQELWSEMFKQVYEDGVDFEASTSYHRLVTELFLSPIILCQLNNIEVPDEVMGRLEKMMEFVMYYTKPDGTVPLIGDADNGRLHRLKTWTDPEREWVDHRYLLAIGAILFGREDFAQAADQWEEAFWLLGEQAIVFKEQFDQKNLPLLQLESRAFPHAGIYVMRYDDDLYMIIDAGPNGQNSNMGHAHCSTLSFELCVDGCTWLVDPGTYTYTSDYMARNYFRSTACHNTVMLDGQEINSFEAHGLFRMANHANPRINRWVTTENYDLLDAQHSGFRRLPKPVIHRRQIYFDRHAAFWILQDVFTGEGEHRFDIFFHWAPVQVVRDEAEPLAILGIDKKSGTRLLISPLLNDGLSLRIDRGIISQGYGTRTEAPVVCYSKRAEVPTQFITLIFPCSKDSQLASLIRQGRQALNKIRTQ